jgi:hypothetical protein
MKRAKGILGTIYSLLFTSEFMSMKLSVVGLIMAAYIGYKHHEPIGRLEANLFKKNIKVEKGYFPDGMGLGIEIPINSSGHREAYLIHHESGKKVAIMYDMLPQTDTMLEGLINRVELMNSTEARTSLIKVNELERKLYDRF